MNMKTLITNRIKYSIYAKLANACTALYLTNTNSVIGDFFYEKHKLFTIRAHTARVNAEREQNVKA